MIIDLFGLNLHAEASRNFTDTANNYRISKE